jgi:hypothetical protein
MYSQKDRFKLLKMSDWASTLLKPCGVSVSALSSSAMTSRILVKKLGLATMSASVVFV